MKGKKQPVKPPVDLYWFFEISIRTEKKIQLKALVVKNSVLHDFGFGKVSPAKQL